MRHLEICFSPLSLLLGLIHPWDKGRENYQWFNVPEAANTPNFMLLELMNSLEQDEEFPILPKRSYSNETDLCTLIDRRGVVSFGWIVGMVR